MADRANLEGKAAEQRNGLEQELAHDKHQANAVANLEKS
jgi:hypothetical protein